MFNTAGYSALIWACRSGHLAVVNQLLAHGARIEELLEDGSTLSAISIATEFGHMDTVARLNQIAEENWFQALVHDSVKLQVCAHTLKSMRWHASDLTVKDATSQETLPVYSVMSICFCLSCCSLLVVCLPTCTVHSLYSVGVPQCLCLPCRGAYSAELSRGRSRQQTGRTSCRGHI